MVKTDSTPVIAAIARVVRLSTRHAWVVIAAFLIAAVLAGAYVKRHIAINTDSGTLLSSSLPWRQQEIKLNHLFPQRTDLILAVIDATTPEAADEAADALVKALAPQTNVIRNVSRPDGGEFFARNGILFLSVDDLRQNMDQLIKAEPFLGTLALDPTLRGILGAISQSLEGVRLKKTTLEDLKPALAAIAMLSMRSSRASIRPSPGANCSPAKRRSPRISGGSSTSRPSSITAICSPEVEATKAVRAAIAKLGLTPDRGVTVRLTGSVPLSDEEFATIADGAALNGAVTLVIVLLILWLALKQARIIVAVLVNLAVGLSFTAAAGLAMVGALNLISVAFAVLFIGLGVDFGIQFSVRYRAERFADRDLLEALETTGLGVARPLLLAAASIAAAFYSFLPTAYVGLSELGLIAGTGMIIAFLTTVTLLPALLAVLKPAGEAAPVGWAWLAPLDHFLDRQRNWVVGLTLAAVVLGLPLLRGLSFDFNPLNLRSKHVEFGLDPARSDARSEYEPQHHRYSGAQSRRGFGDGGEAQAAARGRQSPDAGKLRAQGSGREAGDHRRRQLLLRQYAQSRSHRPRADSGRNPRGDQQDGRRSLHHTSATWTAPAAAQARRLASALTRSGEGAACDQGGGGARTGYAAHDDASPGARSPLGRARDDRHASARAQKRLGRGRRRGQDRGEAERGWQ